ncbi:MAG: flavin reductase family protein [Chloroflexi bacterium]|nr:flavin reductase family protein [Chloroflexota bacterium]
MPLTPVPPEHWTAQPIGLFEPGWLLLTAGDFSAGRFNAMTVSWGSLGVIWNKPFAQVVVRPQRYTFQFLEQYPTFTLCAFPRQFRKALSLLGSRSGRDGDKIAASGLTPIPAAVAAAPVYAEASLAIECRKLYWQDLDPTHFLDPAIQANYPHNDYHRAFFGEILAVSAASGQ